MLNDLDDMVQYDWQSYEDQVELIIKRTVDSIRNLKEKSLTSGSFTSQYREHLDNIFYLLDKYLKGNKLST